jgi:NAD(P)H-dependent FMN reductase
VTTKIGIILGTTREARRGELVADWVTAVTGKRDDGASYELIDLAKIDLPLLDEPQPAIFGAYSKEHTKRWSETIAAFDGFVFITPEYNHSVPSSLKNAVDFLFSEWNNKAAGIVSYGMNGGVRAAEHLRLILAELKVATVRTQVTLSIFSDFSKTSATEPGTCSPGPHHEELLNRLLDEVLAWAEAFRPLREQAER